MIPQKWLLLYNVLCMVATGCLLLYVKKLLRDNKTLLARIHAEINRLKEYDHG